MSLREKVLSTMKSSDTEGAFELYITRTPGYLWALFFRKLHIHPIAVTLMSIILGAASGYFFYSDNLKMNAIGMLLLIWANWYDCADGQLARMSGQKTLLGRILDGFAGDVWFFSIYFFLCLRLTADFGVWIWLLGAYAGFKCHTQQCAIADYYRNIHLWFLMGKDGSELTTSRQEEEEFNKLKWISKDWFHKLYLFFYIRYTKGQEKQTPKFQMLYKCIQEEYHGIIPQETRVRFREDSLPLMPATNILTFDTRIGVLFLSLIAGMPWIYFVFEVTVLEFIRIHTKRRHEAFCEKHYLELTHK